MIDPNKPKKVKQKVFAKPKPVDIATLSSALDIQCRKTGQPVNVNEYVKIYGRWYEKFLGIRKFVWNKHLRCFQFQFNKKMSSQTGISNFEDIKSADLFSMAVEKLNMDEMNEIVMPNL